MRFAALLCVLTYDGKVDEQIENEFPITVSRVVVARQKIVLKFTRNLYTTPNTRAAAHELRQLSVGIKTIGQYE